MSDVIELGADGAFELPLPPAPVKHEGASTSAQNIKLTQNEENDPYLEVTVSTFLCVHILLGCQD